MVPPVTMMTMTIMIFSVDSGNNGRNVGGGGGGGVAMPVHCLTKTFVVTIKHLFFFCRRILLTALS